MTGDHPVTVAPLVIMDRQVDEKMSQPTFAQAWETA